MRFVIEQRHITDEGGKPLTDATASFFTFDAESAEDAARLFSASRSAELLGPIRSFPGFQAVATVRGTNGVYTLQVMPASQQIVS